MPAGKARDQVRRSRRVTGRSITALLLVSTLIGCATFGVTRGGREIELLTEAPEGLQDEYEELSVLSCRRDLNVGDLDANVIRCHNQLKNEAAQLGGDLLIVNEQELGRAGCESCVRIVATAYRRR